MNCSFSCLGSVYSGSSSMEVKQAIDSLLFGTLKPDEIVVVIDGPISEELDALLAEYVRLEHVRTLRCVENRGLGLALRLGLDACSHDIVCRFDADDINFSCRLENLVGFFQLPGQRIDIITSSLIEFRESESRLVECRIKHTLVSHRSLSDSLLVRNTINHPTVAFRKSSIMSVGSYEDIPLFEDYFLWLKARKAGLRFVGIDQPLVCMRRASIISRRSGLHYFQAELAFFRKCWRRQLLPFSSLPLMALRILSRLLPSSIQFLQDYLPWRGKLLLCCNPARLTHISLKTLGIDFPSHQFPNC
jgi:glycosyltransferase involved in cell wall biosynthesis